MKNFNLNLERDDFISSYNFARISDVVYSETVTEEQYLRLKLNNHTVISRGKNIVFYKLNSFTLKENDIIFCNHSLINELFFHLNKIDKFTNIKIITNQTDSPITEKLYLKKPSCVSKWYSINLDHSDLDLISIPLGLSNEYSPKNPKAEDFLNLYKKDIKKDEVALYMNFQENTNFNERRKIYDYFVDKKWVVSSDPNLKMDSYLEELNKHTFVLCPWGNGFETHRFWETLYAGSIPVLKHHHTYASSENLPVLFVDEYEDINIELLKNFYNSINKKTYNFEKLSMKYWEQKIKKGSVKSDALAVAIKESKLLNIKYFVKNTFKTQIDNKSKKIIYFIRQAKKFPNKLLSLIKK